MSSKTPKGHDGERRVEPDSITDDYGDTEPRTWRDALPFFLAVAVVLILVGGVLLVAFVFPSSDRTSDSARVQYVVNDVYTARNSLNYQQYRASFCDRDVSAPDFPQQAAFVKQNRDDRDKLGQLHVPKMDVTVDGDTAKVDVHSYRGSDESKSTVTTMTVVKQGDDWKVCAS
ncbi:MAG: hypothetical protein QM658_10195 [Gordonia sp. (in: high G+C Gram-positive bacteria)]